MRLPQTLQPGLKPGDRSSRSISSGSLSRESRVKRFVRRLAHIDDMHRPVFPENARSNRLFVLVGRYPYYQPSSLQVVASPDKFLVFVADLTEGAVDTSPQSVVLTRYIETLSTCRHTQHTYILCRGKPARVRSSRTLATASPSVISAIRFPAGYLRNSSGGSGNSVSLISPPACTHIRTAILPSPYAKDRRRLHLVAA